MNQRTLETLLKRVHVRAIPAEHLAGYVAEVKRRINAQPSTVVRAKPSLSPWWGRSWVPAGITAALLMVILLRPMLHHYSGRVADRSLTDEIAVLANVAPEDPVLVDDVVDDPVWLDEIAAHSDASI